MWIKTKPSFGLKRFDAKVAFTKDPWECWEWTGSKSKKGYDYFTYQKRSHAAHRIAWLLFTKRRLSPDIVIMHLCDNPSCVNPCHLKEGNNTLNNKDRDEKGRGARGEKCGRSKLKAKDVKEIRALRKDGKKLRELSQIFKVSTHTISYICLGRIWKEIT